VAEPGDGGGESAWADIITTLQPLVHWKLVYRVAKNRILDFRVVVLGYLRGGVLQQPLSNAGRFSRLREQGAERDAEVLIAKVGKPSPRSYLLPFLMRVGIGKESDLPCWQGADVDRKVVRHLRGQRPE